MAISIRRRQRFQILNLAAGNVDHEIGELGWIAGAFGRFTDHLPAGRLVSWLDHHVVALFQILIGRLQTSQSLWPVSLNGLVKTVTL